MPWIRMPDKHMTGKLRAPARLRTNKRWWTAVHPKVDQMARRPLPGATDWRAPWVCRVPITDAVNVARELPAILHCTSSKTVWTLRAWKYRRGRWFAYYAMTDWLLNPGTSRSIPVMVESVCQALEDDRGVITPAPVRAGRKEMDI